MCNCVSEISKLLKEKVLEPIKDQPGFKGVVEFGFEFGPAIPCIVRYHWEANSGNVSIKKERTYYHPTFCPTCGERLDSEWSKEWPTEPGDYWFYGYRFGKSDTARPRLLRVKVSKNGAGELRFTSEGSFMYPGATEDAHFKKADLPDVSGLIKTVERDNG